MAKAELIDALNLATGEDKAACERVIDALTGIIQTALATGGEVSLSGIGKFSTSERSARKGRNPSTGEAIDIPAKTLPKFKAAKALKDAVAG